MVHPNRFDYKGRSILFIINDNAFCVSYHQSFPATPITAPTSVFPIANQHKEITQVNKLINKSGSRNGLTSNYKHQV